MAHDDYRPRDHDHLVEPFLGPFAEESAAGQRPAGKTTLARIASMLLLLLLLLMLLGGLAWWLTRADHLDSSARMSTCHETDRVASE